MCMNRGFLVCVLVAATIGTTSAAAQTISRLGPSVPAIGGGVRGSNAAYDFKNSIFLVVSAHGGLNGRFVKADGDLSTPGVLIGTQFPIQTADPALGGGWNHFPGVAYSPDAYAGAGGFLVTWHQSGATGGATVHARMVSTSGVLGPESQISADGSWWEAVPDIAYSSASKEFLVVWQGIGIRAQRISAAGQAIGGNFPVTDGSYHRDPAVVYNPTNNQFMVTFGGADATSAFAGFRRVAAGSGTLLGSETLLTRAGAVYISEVAYNATTNKYLAAWYQGGTFGRLVDASGVMDPTVIPLSTTVTAYDALGIEFNTSSGSFLMVSHSTSSFQDGAVELSGGSATPGAAILATSALPSNVGNFYPKVAARVGRAEWLLSTATGFAATTVQRIQSGAVGGPAPAPPTPPPPAPPPPPPCTATPTVTSMTLASGQTTFPIDVIASSSSCTWTATSSVPWLQIFFHATATGSGSVGVSALHNTANSRRTGTITIAGNTVSVQQLGFNAAAVSDFDGDGLSDLVWQYRSTGALAIWTMKGNFVASTQWLNAPAITDPAWQIAGTGDIDGDGFADLVWQNSNDGTISAWLMRGTQVLGASVLNYSPVNPSWKIRGVADVNGDGKADIVWQHDAGWLAVWLMNRYNAIATLILSVPKILDPNWVIAGAGDVNSDGKADILWQNRADGRLGVWLMNGATVIDQRTLSTFNSNLNWKIHGVGDISGDGVADLLWQNEATGALGVWYLNVNSVIGQWNLTIQKLSDLGWNMVGPG